MAKTQASWKSVETGRIKTIHQLHMKSTKGTISAAFQTILMAKSALAPTSLGVTLKEVLKQRSTEFVKFQSVSAAKPDCHIYHQSMILTRSFLTIWRILIVRRHRKKTWSEGGFISFELDYLFLDFNEQFADLIDFWNKNQPAEESECYHIFDWKSKLS